MDRTVAATALGVLLALSTAAVPSMAESDASPDPRPGLSLRNGVLTWTIAGDATGAGALHSARPCLQLTADQGITRICAVRERHAQVTRPDGTVFRVPLHTRVFATGWRLRTRLADLALPASEAAGHTWCRRDRCRERDQSVVVPALRLSGCAANAPWLVHEAPVDVGRAVALTFDDGPGPATRRVLRILSRARVAATFFQLGRMVDRDPNVERRIVESGHAIGNHSYSHPVMNGGDDRQLARATRSMVRAGVPRPCLFRAPYGENPPDVVRLARDRGMVTVHWNTDPGDWRGLGTDQIVATTLAQTRPGSIMVFHDGEDHHAMKTALPRILASLKQRGYRFLTVPELLRLPVSYH